MNTATAPEQHAPLGRPTSPVIELREGRSYVGKDGKVRTITYLSVPNSTQVTYIHGTNGHRTTRISARSFKRWVSEAPNFLCR